MTRYSYEDTSVLFPDIVRSCISTDPYPNRVLKTTWTVLLSSLAKQSLTKEINVATLSHPEPGIEVEYSGDVGKEAIAPEAECQSAANHFSAGTIVRGLNAAKLDETSVRHQWRSVCLNSGLPDRKQRSPDCQDLAKKRHGVECSAECFANRRSNRSMKQPYET